MARTIICPYCFEKFEDDKVLFRSERIIEEEKVLPPGMRDYDDYIKRGHIPEKRNGSISDEEEMEIKQRHVRNWKYFTPRRDEVFEAWWKDHGWTDEQAIQQSMPEREDPIIDPNQPDDQAYLRSENGNFLYYTNDADPMVSHIVLDDGTVCMKRICPHCHNTLPENYGRFPVKFIAIIGIAGSGKTVYLSQLFNNMGSICAQAGLSSTMLNNAANNFVKNNPIAVGRELPESTVTNRFQLPLFYNISYNENRKIVTNTLVFYDIAGENFVQAVPVGMNKFAPYVMRSDAVITLIDPLQFVHVASMSPDAGIELADTTSALMTINNYIVQENSGQATEKPFAVCISKSDLQEFVSLIDQAYPALVGPLGVDTSGIMGENGMFERKFNASDYNTILTELSRLIATLSPQLNAYLNTFISNYALFAFTALGCSVENRCPVGPIYPKRIGEPLLWLLQAFGIIGTNDAIEYPGAHTVHCPHCGSGLTRALTLDERKTTKIEKKQIEEEGLLNRLFKQKTREIEVKVEHTMDENYICEKCSYRWVQDLESSN